MTSPAAPRTYIDPGSLLLINDPSVGDPPPLTYAEITGRVLIAITDRPDDPDRYPDLITPDGGRIIFTPVMSQTMASNQALIALTPKVGTFDTNGFVISPDGMPGLWLIDLGDPTLNPNVPPDQGSYRVSFENITAGGVPLRLAPFAIHPVAGQVNDLGVIAPVIPGQGEPMVRGDDGFSVWGTDQPITIGGTSTATLTVPPDRTAQVGDLVVSSFAGTPGFVGRVIAVAPGNVVTMVYWGSIRGPIGPTGPPNVLTAGPTTTGAPGTQASVVITGTAPNQTVAFTIPRGDVGPQGNPTAFELRGTGSPQGVVSAPVGSYYTDTAATLGAIRWIKQTGTGNTGWRVLWGDTGMRDVTSLLINGWTATTVLIGRLNDTVNMRFSGLNPAAATSNAFMADVGTGWRSAGQPAFPVATNATPTVMARFATPTVATGFQITNWVAGIAGTFAGMVRWPTTDAWPATLPGA